MLDAKKDRLDYGTMLIPPPGYRLTKAVAATYTLDLNTLLSIPVALFFSQTLEGNFEAERIQLLEAIQRCPEVVRVYHQQGKIHVPAKHNRLYGLLEPCVVGIPPKSEFSSFHPKVWVLRYEHDEEVTRYRVIVLSRNLTYDRSWDIAAHLDGEITEEEQSEVKPLVTFVKYLTQHEQFEGHENFITGLRRVRFETPNGFHRRFYFHPLGIDSFDNPLTKLTANSALCISPFVQDQTIQTLRKNVAGEVLLFGRREELRILKPETVSQLSAFCISNLIVDGENHEAGEDGEGTPLAQNLHAKLYVFEQESGRCRWFIGSANATQAAFERNIEFLLELRSSRPSAQLNPLKNDLLGKDESGGIFEPFFLPTQVPDQTEKTQLEKALRLLEFRLLACSQQIVGEVKPSGNETNFDLHVEFPAIDCGSSDLSVKVVPFNSDGIPTQEISVNQKSSLHFENISESQLSRFLKVELWQGKERHRAFLLKIEIRGLPETRISRILRSIINSRDRFFEYLQFLLVDDRQKDVVGNDLDHDGHQDQASGELWETSKPIFEQLLLTASRSPERLQAIDDVIQQLVTDEESPAVNPIVPQEFLSFWEAFKQFVPRQRRSENT